MVESSAPAVLSRQHPGRLYDTADRLEDALWVLRPAKARAPVGEHGEVEAPVVKSEAAGDLPVDARAELSDGVTVRQALEGLEDHHRADELCRHRGAAAPGGEKIGKVFVSKQLRAVIGQKGIDRSLLDEPSAERRRVEELTVRVRSSLHGPILACQQGTREYCRPIKSTRS